MTDFEFYTPTKVIFGQGAVSGIGKEAAPLGKTALLLYGRDSLKKNGLYDLIHRELGKQGIRIVEHPGVQPNPVLPHAEEGVRICRSEGVDFIVAAGGGSVIDEAKGIAAGFYADKDLWEYYSKRAVVDKALPIIAVQTQPATSSETNAASVLTNPERGEKFGLRSPYMIPKAAFLDPSVTFTIPVQYTAYACFDILCHMLEGYFTTTAEFSPIQDGFVEGLSKGVMESLARVLKNPEDYDSRASIMWAGALAWNGLANAGLEGAHIPSHMFEHPLSGLYDIPHGAGLAVVMPAWLKFMKDRISRRIILFGKKILGIENLDESDPSAACDTVIGAFEEFIRSIGCPLSLSETGIDSPDIQELTKQVNALSVLWNIQGYSDKDIAEIYELCL
ncbi:MAG: iron-containing alcohol dehydrogenase [Spirochaetales bacterium]|nr:iron-containing alcohol dehydrogenase [Spirochaetales bacterium]